MKHVGNRLPPPKPPAPAPSPDELEQIAAGMVQLANKRAQAAGIARIAAMHDGLDGPDLQVVPLSDPGVMERIRQDQAKRPAIFGTDPLDKAIEP